MKFTFDLTDEQVAIITNLIQGEKTESGQDKTVSSYITEQVIDRFLAEIENRGRAKKIGTIKTKYEKASDQKKSQIDAILADVVVSAVEA